MTKTEPDSRSPMRCAIDAKVGKQGQSLYSAACHPSLAEASDTYLAVFDDDSHCSSTSRAGKRPAIVSL